MLGALVGRSNRSWPSLSMSDYFEQVGQLFSYGGNIYQTLGGSVAELEAMEGQRNPIVGTCMSILAGCFSEIRFAWQPFEDTRAGLPFGNESLSILERPWPGGGTSDLLVRKEVDRGFYGNSYWVGHNAGLLRLDPHRTKVVSVEVQTPSGHTIGRQLVGYAVVDDSGREVKMYLPDEVAHYRMKLSADPASPFTGVSWLSEVLPDVTVDYQMTEFKKSFVKRGAVPSLVAVYPPDVTKEQVKTVKETIESAHQGAANAFGVLHIGGGADVKTVGLNLEQLQMKALQGASETRIAAAAGVPPVVGGFSEGLQGSQLNAGNYVAARRRFADITMRPLWRTACAAFEKLVTPRPEGRVRLWYEDRDVAFLQEDVKDAAEIKVADASAVRQLVDGGFTAESAVAAVVTGDFNKLQHSGKLSVQLQEPGSDDEGTPDDTDTDPTD